MRQAVCSEIEEHDTVSAIPSDEPHSKENIELFLGDIKISLPGSFNEATLRRLFGVLK